MSSTPKFKHEHLENVTDFKPPTSTSHTQSHGLDECVFGANLYDSAVDSCIDIDVILKYQMVMIYKLKDVSLNGDETDDSTHTFDDDTTEEGKSYNNETIDRCW